MIRRDFLGACVCCGATLLAQRSMAQSEVPLETSASAPLQTGPWQMPERLPKPDSSTDEGGLWALLDREEAKIKRSKFLMRDEALNKYVNDIACRLAGNHCPDMRIYIVRTPIFNASMAPNGMMQIWSGLLLRLNNEAQLAAILGHEIAHYVSRHTLDRFRDMKSRSAFANVLGIALSATGAGAAGSIAQLAILAGMFSYGRDQEHEADRIGLDLIAKAGYDPIEAAKVWDQLLAELKAESDWSGDASTRSVLFASHPREDERRDEMNKQATALNISNGDKGSQRWRAAMQPYQWGFLEDELKRRRSGETLALLERMLDSSPNDGTLYFFRGESLRQRATPESYVEALVAFDKAAMQSNAPPQLYRSKGQILQLQGKEELAKAEYRTYLKRMPNAEDRELISSYLN